MSFARVVYLVAGSFWAIRGVLSVLSYAERIGDAASCFVLAFMLFNEAGKG